MRAKKGKLTPEQRARRAAHARALSADRVVVERRNARSAVTNAEPEVKEKHRQACQAAKALQMADPTYVERMREAGRAVGRGNLVRANMPDARRRAAETLRAKMLAWCPRHLWPLNETLKRNGYLLAERQAMVAEQVEREQAQAEAERRASWDALSPFDKQLARVRAGARVVAKPSFRKADHDFTLGGVATGML